MECLFVLQVVGLCHPCLFVFYLPPTWCRRCCTSSPESPPTANTLLLNRQHLLPSQYPFLAINIYNQHLSSYVDHLVKHNTSTTYTTVNPVNKATDRQTRRFLKHAASAGGQIGSQLRNDAPLHLHSRQCLGVLQDFSCIQVSPTPSSSSLLPSSISASPSLLSASPSFSLASSLYLFSSFIEKHYGLFAYFAHLGYLDTCYFHIWPCCDQRWWCVIYHINILVSLPILLVCEILTQVIFISGLVGTISGVSLSTSTHSVDMCIVVFLSLCLYSYLYLYMYMYGLVVTISGVSLSTTAYSLLLCVLLYFCICVCIRIHICICIFLDL